jgi:hypothetical protein
MYNPSIIFNTLPRTGMNYFSFVISYSLDMANYKIKTYENIHSPTFAAVTPPNAIQFFIKRDPIDSIQSNIYAQMPILSEKELIEKLDIRFGENTKEWIFHLSNVKANPNIEVVSFDDFKTDTVSLVKKIGEKTGLPFKIDESIVEKAVSELDKLYKMSKSNYNYMPVEKREYNSIIRDYIVANDLYGKKNKIYDLYNSIEPTIML